jgi:predicted ATPase
MEESEKDWWALIEDLADGVDREIKHAHARLRAQIAGPLRAAPRGEETLRAFDRAFRDLADAVNRQAPQRPFD